MSAPRLAVGSAAEGDGERRLLLIFGLGSFVVSLDSRVVSPLLPAIASEFGISSANAGWVVSSYLLPYGFFQLVYGPIADRLGKITVAAIAMAVFSGLTALSGVSPSFGALLLMRALTGGAAAAMIPLSIAYVGDTVPYTRRQVALSRLMATMGMAHAVSAAVGGAIGELLSWREVFLPLGVLAGAVAALLALHRGFESSLSPGLVKQRYRDAVRAPGMLPLLLVVGFEGCLFMGILPHLSGLFESRFAFGTLAIGALISLSGAAQLLAAWLMPALLRRGSESALIVGGGGAMGVAYLIVAAAPSWPWAALGSALVGLGFSVCHSTLQTRATEAFPRGRATALALFAFSLFAGSSLGSIGFSWVSGRVGYGPAFAACGLLFFAFTAAVWRVLSRRSPVATPSAGQASNGA